MKLCFDAILYSKLGNKNSDVGCRFPTPALADQDFVPVCAVFPIVCLFYFIYFVEFICSMPAS